MSSKANEPGASARRVACTYCAGVVDVAPEYRMEEIEVTSGCEASGKRIDEVRGEALVVALRRGEGGVEPEPPGNTVLGDGDVLVAIGETRALEQLENLLAATVG